MLEISVIIPTRNRSRLLRDCLASLLTQKLAPERYEICVVDNASTDDTKQVVAALATQYPTHKLFLVEENILGVAQARSRGLEITSGALVAYGDDDAMMPPDWLERYINRFAELPPDVAKIGGEIIPIWEKVRPTWLTDAMMCLLSARSSVASDHARFCKPGAGEVLIECNCCYRREVLQRMGAFPAALGRKGDNLLSGENAVDFRLAAEGAGFFYDPEITISHFIHAGRLNLEWFRRRYFWQGVTDFVVRGYLESHNVRIPSSHAISVPMSEADWAMMTSNETATLDETLRKIRGIGFMMAMIGAI